MTSLRSILGGSRVRKRSSSAKRASSSPRSSSASSSSAAALSAWAASLAKTQKSGTAAADSPSSSTSEKSGLSNNNNNNNNNKNVDGDDTGRGHAHQNPHAHGPHTKLEDLGPATLSHLARFTATNTTFPSTTQSSSSASSSSSLSSPSLPASAPSTSQSQLASPCAPLPSPAAPAVFDALQTHRLILRAMFEPLLPSERGSGGTATAAAAAAGSWGLSSTQVSASLRFRAALPRLVSAPHLRAELRGGAAGAVRDGTSTCSGGPRGGVPTALTPAAAEREVARSVREGRLRRVLVPSRGWVGELMVESEVLEGMVLRASGGSGGGMDKGLGERFVGWLRANPGRLRFEGPGVEGFSRPEVDALVRAGFLTALNEGFGAGRGAAASARPEGRYAMISLETVARAPAGSVAAVGGEGAVHAAGGTGTRSMAGPPAGSAVTSGGFSVAVPGTGMFLKFVSAALEHLADLLRRTQYREMPESDLREKWDGGVAGDSQVALAKKARGEFSGVLPGRTKKWREFHGLAFGWVLQEAVGAGLVEVFETRSVGRGVRLV